MEAIREAWASASRSSLVTAFAVLILAYATLSYLGGRKKTLPPGPYGLPILGNVLQLTKLTKDPWLTFTTWKETYGGYSFPTPLSVSTSLISALGPIVHINAIGRSIIVLNDSNVVEELMDRRAVKTSGRPEIIVGEVMTGGLMLPFMPSSIVYVPIKAVFRGVIVNVNICYLDGAECVRP